MCSNCTLTSMMRNIYLIFLIVFHTASCNVIKSKKTSIEITKKSQNYIYPITPSSDTPNDAQKASKITQNAATPSSVTHENENVKFNSSCAKLPFNCPPVSDPHCVKMKYTTHDKRHKTIYIRVINKCEMEYMNCYEGPIVVEVPLKYCESKKIETQRVKRESSIIAKDLLDLLGEVDKKRGLTETNKNKQLRKGKSPGGESSKSDSRDEESDVPVAKGGSSSESEYRVVKMTQARRKRSVFSDKSSHIAKKDRKANHRFSSKLKKGDKKIFRKKNKCKKRKMKTLKAIREGSTPPTPRPCTCKTKCNCPGVTVTSPTTTSPATV